MRVKAFGWRAVLFAVAISLTAGCVPKPPPGGNPPVKLNPADVPKNVDDTKLHLLKFGEVKRPPNIQGAKDVLNRLGDGAKARAIAAALGVPAGVASAYTAVGTVNLLTDIYEVVNGGTKMIVERFSGYCKDVWEIYSKVRVRTSGASSSADGIWESVSRAPAQYLRFLFQTYLKRQPTCDEMRGYLGGNYVGKFQTGETFSASWGRSLLRNIVCDLRDGLGRRWSQQLNPYESSNIETFCTLPHGSVTQQNAMVFANNLAEALTERCDPSTIADSTVRNLRHRVHFAEMKYLVDDIKASVGRPQDYLDLEKYKVGKMVTHLSVLTAFFFNPNGDPARHVTLLNSGRTERNHICDASRKGKWGSSGGSLGGPAIDWIQSPNNGANAMITESNRIVRNFADIGGGAQLGEDVLAKQIGDVNIWTGISGIAAPPSCGTGTITYRWPDGVTENRPNGWTCDPRPAPGDSGWRTLNDFLREFSKL